MKVGTKLSEICGLAANMLIVALDGKHEELSRIPYAAISPECPRLSDLLAGLSGDSDLAARTINNALVAEVITILKLSISADGRASREEFAHAADILAPVFNRFTPESDYSHFTPISAENIPGLFAHWAKDKTLFGGDFSEGAQIIPFGWCVLLASLAVEDTGLFEHYAKIATLLISVIINEGGVTPEERKCKTSYLERVAEMRAWCERYLALKKPQARTEITATLARAASEKGSRPQAEVLGEAVQELERLVGVNAVKAEVQKLINFLLVRQKRLAAGLPEVKQTLHFVFTGNPGTGKTTVARIVAKILHGCEVLGTPNLFEADRAMLVGGYVGQTAIKTSEVIEKSLNGVLFIDEAYSLAGGAGRSDFGDEAIETLLKRMEDHRDKLSVIVAGYPKQMEEFVATNPGLESRFTRYLHFADYHVADLCQIFEGMCDSHSYALTSEARANAAILFNAAHAQRDETFGNARFVRNVYEQTIGNQANRLAHAEGELTKEILSTIEASDLPFDMVPEVGGPKNVVKSKWRVQCPGCRKQRTIGVSDLGEPGNCGCGASYRNPWWNLKPETVADLHDWSDSERPEDVLGYQMDKA